MADTTALWALPFPESSDPVQAGASDIEALAEDVSALLTPYDDGAIGSRPTSTPGSPGIAGRTYRATDTGQLFIDYGTGWLELGQAVPLVTAFPATLLYEGRLVDLQTAAMATKGIVWRFRYRSGATTYKWEFVGGPAWAVEVATAGDVATNDTYAVPTVAGPSITLPFGGDFHVEHEAEAQHDVSGTWRITQTLAVNGTAVDADRASATVPVTTPAMLSRSKLKTGMASGAVLTLQAKTSSLGTTATLINRRLSVLPVHGI
jgi:hypothetical protein